MTDQERAALIAWLDEHIAECEKKADKDIDTNDSIELMLSTMNFGSLTTLRKVKAHIESEATHDEA